jgi:Protein of unknown function (DUF3107)
VEVKIGVKGANRELVVETAASADDVAAAVRAALTDDAGVLVLSDDKGRQVMVPADKVAYVELGESETRKVGFGAL